MKLHEVLALFEDVDPEAWQKVDPVNWGEANQHYYRAVYLDDVAIAVEWGATVNEKFYEKWLDNFPDHDAKHQLAEVVYNGAVIYQQHYVSVDGARASLPLPKMNFKERDNLGEAPEVESYSVTGWETNFMQLLNELTNTEPFDRYLSTAGFKIVG